MYFFTDYTHLYLIIMHQKGRYMHVYLRKTLHSLTEILTMEN